MCVTSPSHMLGTATVEVAANGVDFSSDGRTFEFVAVRVLDLEPASGPTAGGTAITIRGRGFGMAYFATTPIEWGGESPDGLACAWDGAMSPASLLSTQVCAYIHGRGCASAYAHVTRAPRAHSPRR